MKKTLLAIILSGGAIMATNASANTGTVNFTGKVTSATCDIVPEVNGAQVASIDLGIATLTQNGNPVDFKLKASGANAADCLAKTSARIEWSGDMNTQGFNNLATTSAAEGFHMVLRATNGGTGSAGANITSNYTAVDYNIANGISSFDYRATLTKSGTAPQNGYKAGLFNAAASFVVTYL